MLAVLNSLNNIEERTCLIYRIQGYATVNKTIKRVIFDYVGRGITNEFKDYQAVDKAFHFEVICFVLEYSSYLVDTCCDKAYTD